MRALLGLALLAAAALLGLDSLSHTGGPQPAVGSAQATPSTVEEHVVYRTVAVAEPAPQAADQAAPSPNTGPAAGPAAALAATALAPLAAARLPAGKPLPAKVKAAHKPACPATQRYSASRHKCVVRHAG
jgi:hypothetical protein